MKENTNINAIFLGKNIQYLRNQKGWSVDILSKKLNKQASTIRTYESNKASPTLNSFIEIVRLFNVNAHSLIFRDIEKAESKDNTDKSFHQKYELIEAQKQTIEAQKKLIEHLESQLKAKDQNID